MEKYERVPIAFSAVTIIIIRPHEDGPRVLTVRRSESWLKGAWALVTGGIDPGEAAWHAAVREVGEETALPIEALYSAEFCDMFYLADRDELFVSAGFLVITDADTPVTLDDDHDDHRWCTLAEADALLDFPGQRKLLAEIWAHFVDRPPSRYLRLDPRTGALNPEGVDL